MTPAFVLASIAYREPLARRLPGQEEPQSLPASDVVVRATPVGRKGQDVQARRHNVKDVGNQTRHAFTLCQFGNIKSSVIAEAVKLREATL